MWQPSAKCNIYFDCWEWLLLHFTIWHCDHTKVWHDHPIKRRHFVCFNNAYLHISKPTIQDCDDPAIHYGELFSQNPVTPCPSTGLFVAPLHVLLQDYTLTGWLKHVHPGALNTAVIHHARLDPIFITHGETIICQANRLFAQTYWLLFPSIHYDSEIVVKLALLFFFFLPEGRKIALYFYSVMIFGQFYCPQHSFMNLKLDIIS